MAEQGGPAKPAQCPDVPVSRQCAGACRTDRRSPSGNPAPAGIEPDEDCELVSAAPPHARGRLRVRAGGCAASGTTRMTEQRRLAAIVSADVAGYSLLLRLQQ